MTLDLKEKQTQFHLLSLLKEVHERVYPMMEYCEKLQQDPEFDHNIYDDQTSRSILKDLRKVIKSLEKQGFSYYNNNNNKVKWSIHRKKPHLKHKDMQ